jgi:type I pantothenate kinase
VSEQISPFVELSREQWAGLRAQTPLTLSAADVEELRGLNEAVSLDEVEQIYLPLSRLLNLSIGATQELHRATGRFLDQIERRVPFVIGLAGSVAVGKSTTSRILRALLERWPDHPRVDLVTTDGFLLPNAELERRGLLERKGFPESYDRRRLLAFVAEVKSGAGRVEAPVYSHLLYDIVPGESQVVEDPDVLIIEGLNVLQAGGVRDGRGPRVFVSDYFDFSIYVDADEADVRRWYVERFLTLRETVFRRPESYFRRFADLSDEEAVRTAGEIWDAINGPNLHENILPTRERGRLILRKGPDHAVQSVRLRKL